MSEACQIARKQDLPPPGGYKPIPYKRLPAKQLLSGKYYFIFVIFKIFTLLCNLSVGYVITILGEAIVTKLLLVFLLSILINRDH